MDVPDWFVEHLKRTGESTINFDFPLRVSAGRR